MRLTGAEIDRPEAGRRLQEFNGYKSLSRLGSGQACYAAGEILVGLQIGDKKRLSSVELYRKSHQSSLSTDVGCFGLLREGFPLRAAVDENGHGCSYTLGPPLLEAETKTRTTVLRFAAEGAPSRKK